MTEFGQPVGELDLPLLTLHTTDDGRVIPANERAYRDAVLQHGRASALRQLFVSRGGHCAFSDAEIIAAFEALIQRVDTGGWPDMSPTTMTARAARVGAAYGRSAPLGYAINDSGQFVDFSPRALPR